MSSVQSFETLGNATVMVFQDGRPLDHPLTEAQIENVKNAEYLWISDHYDSDIKNWLIEVGFDPEVLKYRQWRQLSPGVRVLCMDNSNQDSVLVIEAGDSLIVNLLIDNFAKVRLANTKPYPHFTPLVSKVGRLGLKAQFSWLPLMRKLSDRLGIKRPLKYVYRAMLGDPVR